MTTEKPGSLNRSARPLTLLRLPAFESIKPSAKVGELVVKIPKGAKAVLLGDDLPFPRLVARQHHV